MPSSVPRMQEFLPHLEVLAAAQRKLWTELSAVPGEFTLYGGTALALHLGHRNSIDFDFSVTARSTCQPSRLEYRSCRAPGLSSAKRTRLVR